MSGGTSPVCLSEGRPDTGEFLVDAGGLGLLIASKIPRWLDGFRCRRYHRVFPPNIAFIRPYVDYAISIFFILAYYIRMSINISYEFRTKTLDL